MFQKRLVANYPSSEYNDSEWKNLNALHLNLNDKKA